MAEPAPIIAPLRAADRAAWEVLARGYKEFYRTPTSPEEYDAAWRRLLARDEIFGLAARLDGEIVGIAHYVLHKSAWAERVCYLQDLFVAPEIRGRGVARSLIDAVAQAAREAGASRYYWQTMHDNAVARALYDKLARFKGFIRYDYPLEPARAKGEA